MRIGQILVLVLLAVGAFGQQQAPPSKIKLVVVGQIAKVDKPKRSVDIRTMREAARERTEPFPEVDIGVRIGRFPDATRPGGSRRDEPVFPDEPSTPDWPEPRRTPQSVTKVFLTEDTACKQEDNPILCDDLKASDSVRVTGEERLSDPRGKGLYATEIIRSRPRL
jgi:hypothetical protein